VALYCILYRLCPHPGARVKLPALCKTGVIGRKPADIKKRLLPPLKTDIILMQAAGEVNRYDEKAYLCH
jgi:hypothetical protein